MKKSTTPKKKTMKGTIVKFSLIKAAVRSDVGTVLYFSPRGSERELKVGDKVEFSVVESLDYNTCKDVKKV